LGPDETILIETSDDLSDRIGNLIDSSLVLVASMLGAVLYEDVNDGRMWESETILPLMGGGPCVLHNVPLDFARAKFDPSIRERLDSIGMEIYGWRRRLTYWDGGEGTAIEERDLQPQQFESIMTPLTLAAIPDRSMAARLSWLDANYFRVLRIMSGRGRLLLAPDGRYWEMVYFDLAADAFGGGTKSVVGDRIIYHLVDPSTALVVYA
jgi:hypothetical protein